MAKGRVSASSEGVRRVLKWGQGILYGCWLTMLLLLGGGVRAAAEKGANGQPVHHLMNARLLQEQEMEVSLWGNLKYGLGPDLELGSNAWLLMGSIYNFTLKHQMFRWETMQTSFVTHSFVTFSKLSGEFFLLAPLGVIHSLELPHQASLSLNLGLFDIFQWRSDSEERATVMGHIFSTLLGLDWTLSASWSLSAYGLLPLYAYYEAASDSADATASVYFYRRERLGVPYLALYYLGMSYAFSESWSLEFGSFRFIDQSVPYVNLVWRFL